MEFQKSLAFVLSTISLTDLVSAATAKAVELTAKLS